jgi:hypothetical protein
MYCMRLAFQQQIWHMLLSRMLLKPSQSLVNDISPHLFPLPLLHLLLLFLTVPPAFTAGATVSLAEDTPFPGTQWATVTSLGTNTAPTSNTRQASQQLISGPAFSVVPTSSCKMLVSGPNVNTTGFLTFGLVENGFGMCSFNVTLCDSVACSPPQRLVVDVAEGEI